MTSFVWLWIIQLRYLPPSTSATKVSSLEDSNLYRSKRKLGDGHFTADIKVISLSGGTPFSPDILQVLELLGLELNILWI